MDSTVSDEEYALAMKLEVGDKMLLRYGENPVKTGNLIRKEDNNE
jgi:AICAR transformylase/IMP cyclohydrolase PurH